MSWTNLPRRIVRVPRCSWSAGTAEATGSFWIRKAFCGGLFVDRAEAVKFAMFENGHRPQAVIMVPGILELDMSGKPAASGEATTGHAGADAQHALARAA